MKILYGVAEYYPLIKTGGLGDAAGAFTKALSKRHKVYVALPGYSKIDRKQYEFKKIPDLKLSIPIGDKEVEGYVEKANLDKNLTIYLICNDHYFDRENLFGDGITPYKDNAERFLFFSRGILELACYLENIDVIHLNDWHTAIGMFYLKEFYRKLGKIKPETKSVFTIHNLGYQGIFWHYDMYLLNVDWKYFNPEGLEFYNHINYMKSGILYSDIITTVSPTYAKEIQTPEFGFGLDGVLRKRSKDLYGILNGVDYSVWHPWKDKFIPYKYNRKLFSRKLKNKLEIQKELGLKINPDKPLLVMVSRLIDQKGIELITPVFDMLVKLDTQIIILGTGDKHYIDFFNWKEHQFKGTVVGYMAYNEEVAHKLYAAGDIYLMPSKYEPCGLSQMYAMKYGTVPVVRNTGGLKDTVIDIEEGIDRATGFKFDYYSPYAFYEAVRKAVALYKTNREEFTKLALNGMNTKFSWEKTVKKYLELYRN